MRDNFTVETSIKARETLDEQRTKYRKDYTDDEYWKELAKSIGVRIPPYYTRPSDADIKHWLKTCKVPYSQFVEAYGWKDSAEFEKMNPTHGMKIIAGLILELREENLRVKKLAEERSAEFGLKIGASLPPKLRMYVGESKIARKNKE